MNFTARTRRLFLSPQATYSRAEAASLLDCTVVELDRSIADGQLELTSSGSGDRLAWCDVAAALVDAHPHADIEQALGADAATVLPQLLMLAELRADIPLYQIATITALAERDAVPIGEILSRSITDLASVESDWLEQQVPGFRAAFRWPHV